MRVKYNSSHSVKQLTPVTSVLNIPNVFHVFSSLRMDLQSLGGSFVVGILSHYFDSDHGGYQYSLQQKHKDIWNRKQLFEAKNKHTAKQPLSLITCRIHIFCWIHGLWIDSTWFFQCVIYLNLLFTFDCVCVDII